MASTFSLSLVHRSQTCVHTAEMEMKLAEVKCLRSTCTTGPKHAPDDEESFMPEEIYEFPYIFSEVSQVRQLCYAGALCYFPLSFLF